MWGCCNVERFTEYQSICSHILFKPHLQHPTPQNDFMLKNSVTQTTSLDLEVSKSDKNDLFCEENNTIYFENKLFTSVTLRISKGTYSTI